MAAIKPESLPSYLYSHVHPGLEIPIGTALKGIQAVSQIQEDVDQKQWNLQFRKNHFSILDADPELVGLLDPECYAAACQFASLYIDRLESLSKEELKNFLCSLNAQILGLNSSSYRNQMMTIFHLPNFEKIWADSEEMRTYIEQHDPDSLQYFDSLLEFEYPQFAEEILQSDSEDLIGESCVLSEESKQMLKRYAHICCFPKFISDKMDRFLQEINQQLQKPEVNPIQLAAFAHMRIVQIHPFQDGNGRTARLFMNMILQKYGLPPIYFYSEEEYSKEVKLALRDLHSFAWFIQRKVHYFQNIQKIAKEEFSSIHKQQNFIRKRGLFTLKWKNILGPCTNNFPLD